MDWRAQAPPQVQDDYDMLLRDGVDAAAQILAESDSFAPFMLVIDQTGRKTLRRLAQPRVHGGEQTATSAMETGTDRSTLRARATVFDVTVSAPFAGSAIKAVLEHRDGPAVDVLVPYTATPDELRIDFTAADGAVGTGRLWG
ncbi:hypothetical protein ABZ942_09595 [Nocardia sp. NPDC046473]|uniref:hypothetical protein n=1 Tax=Nocardia sp. NPDC046473 TaxID=3155733 RepID=UPI00340DC473